ncbi:MAG: TauD/TfdA family dioxygenase [Burkholderiaceae bacterium]
MIESVADRPALVRGSPFDLDDDDSYRRWRAGKLAARVRRADELIVDVADPERLEDAEREAILQRCAAWNMAIYRLQREAADPAAALRARGARLGLRMLDANWLADDDGLSSITVRSPEAAPGADAHGAYIPYTDRAIRWHTDGYYHEAGRRIRAMLLHCVRPAREGGINALVDHELAYIALRDASVAWVRALMAGDAMTIPERRAADGSVRAAQSGPVFSVDARDGALHMRYTARTRSIAWKDDRDTRAAAAFLEQWLNEPNEQVLRLRLDAGMGLVCHNVLHDRSAFADEPAQPRLLLRARYLDRLAAPSRG